MSLGPAAGVPLPSRIVAFRITMREYLFPLTIGAFCPCDRLPAARTAITQIGTASRVSACRTGKQNLLDVAALFSFTLFFAPLIIASLKTGKFVCQSPVPGCLEPQVPPAGAHTCRRRPHLSFA